MKNTETNKADARPWHYNPRIGIIHTSGGKRIAGIAYGSNALPTQGEHDNAELIVSAVNEYAALCAVADAAQWLNIAIAENKLWGQAEEAVNEARIKLGDALANLAAMRNGGAKPIPMNTETKIYLALNLDKAPALRRIAACVAYRYWMEMHRYGEFANNSKAISRLVKRFRLGDFICALSAHYPIR